MKPLILELDEELRDGEEFIGTKTVGCKNKQGKMLIGHVAVIRVNHLDYRYGSLRAYSFDKEMGNVI